jgi:hypothetical protein
MRDRIDEQDFAQGIEEILFNVVHLDEIFADKAEKVEHGLEIRNKKAEGRKNTIKGTDAHGSNTDFE